MHGVVMCVGGGGVRVLVGTRAANSVALAPATPALPSRLVGPDGDDVMRVGVAWVRSAGTS